MLQTRRVVGRLLQRPYRYQLREYVDMKPPDPTNTNRSPDNKPVSEPLGGGDSSGTNSLHAASAGHHEPTHHAHHPEPVNESLGRGFYASLAALALSFAVYKFSRSSSSDPVSAGDPNAQPLITRLISSFNYFQDKYAERNALHTSMVEQAGHDRNLFYGSPGSQHIDLKFPEIFNTGSPYNVPAGSAANLDELRAHYQRQNVEAENKRYERVERQMRDSAGQSQSQATDPKKVIGATIGAVESVAKKAAKGE